VRWNSAVGDFTDTFPFGVGGTIAFGNGSRFRARATDSAGGGGPSVLLQAWINDTLVYQQTDASAQRILSGSPGIGFYISPFNASSCFSTPSAFGIRSITARELAA
jgi:hypothetical protein